MERKKALALASLMVTLFASFALITPPVRADPQNVRYIVIGGVARTCAWIHDFALKEFDPDRNWRSTFQTRPPYFTPGDGWQNITFSDPDPETGVVNLTVPAESYRGLHHIFQDLVTPERPNATGWWFNISIFAETDGYGWLFTGEATDPNWQALPNGTIPAVDIDVITFNNYTGVYWNATGEFAGPPPQVGADGIPGTGDDGFGDGTPDPKGSSILYLNTTLHLEQWDGDSWEFVYEAPFYLVFTTAISYDCVKEPASLLNGINSTMTGHPWEFLYSGAPWGDPKSNVWVYYVCAWSVLNMPIAVMGLPAKLDLIYESSEYKVRADYADDIIGDANWDQLVDMRDIGLACGAYGSYDETFPSYPEAHPRFDARTDCNKDSLVDMRDIGVMCAEYGNEILYP